jgi:hypothetical protein
VFKPELLARLNVQSVAFNACTTTNLGIACCVTSSETNKKSFVIIFLFRI